MAEPAPVPVEVRAYPRLWWGHTRRSFSSCHPRTLRRVLETRPDHLWGDNYFIRARGDHGAFYLNLAGSRMLRGEKVFCRQNPKGRNHNIGVPSAPLPEFEEFSSR